MSYELLTDEEFTHELDVFKTMTERLRSQAEKLVTLKSEGRVSDQVYNEVLNEIYQRSEVLNQKMTELTKASEEKNLKLKEELKNLRYQLESYEVRFAVGSMPEDQYKMMRASLLLRIQEIEELLNRANALFTGAVENTNKTESIIGKRKRFPQTQPTATPQAQQGKAIELTPTVEASRPQIQAPAPVTEKEKTSAAKRGMKNCPRCGAENPDNAIYCYNCGAKL